MLVARADGLGSTCSLPAGGFLLRVGVDAQRPLPRKAGADLGRVERQHGIQVTRLQEGWQVAVELGIDRLDDRLTRQLPRRREAPRWVRSAPRVEPCGKQRCGAEASYTPHGSRYLDQCRARCQSTGATPPEPRSAPSQEYRGRC